MDGRAADGADPDHIDEDPAIGAPHDRIAADQLSLGR
jgi:hypothetical protein